MWITNIDLIAKKIVEGSGAREDNDLSDLNKKYQFLQEIAISYLVGNMNFSNY